MMDHDLIEEEPEAGRIMEEKLLRELDGWVPPEELLGTRVFSLPYIPLGRKLEGA